MAIQRRWGRFVWHRKHGGPRRTRLGDGDPGQATITVNHFECAHPYLFLSPAVHSPFLWCFIPSHSATALFLHSALWSSPHCLSCWRCAPSLRESSLETAPLPSTWAAQQGRQFPPREPSNKVASPLSASHPTSPLIPSTRASGVRTRQPFPPRKPPGGIPLPSTRAGLATPRWHLRFFNLFVFEFI